jgi:hypothetical protein
MPKLMYCTPNHALHNNTYIWILRDLKPGGGCLPGALRRLHKHQESAGVPLLPQPEPAHHIQVVKLVWS